MRRWTGILLCLALALALPAAADTLELSLDLSATAYNSVPEQTDDTPTLAAWGDVLDPGMKVIAVSRDLLDMGLGYGTVVRLDGIPGDYIVLDKMASRWTNRIDIYMGNDVTAARRWGVRPVVLRWDLEDALFPEPLRLRAPLTATTETSVVEATPAEPQPTTTSD